jgi:hypothetical protein
MRWICNENNSSSSKFQHGIRANLGLRSFLGAWVLHSFPILLYRTTVLLRLPFGIVQLDIAHHNLGCITHRRYYRRSLGCPSDECQHFLVITDPSRTLLSVFDGLIVNKVAFLVFFGKFWFTLEFFEAYRRTWVAARGPPVTARPFCLGLTKRHVVFNKMTCCLERVPSLSLTLLNDL